LPTARGQLIGISSENYTPEHLIRAAIEGVSFGVLNGLDLVLAGKSADAIQVIGGGAKSAEWRQLFADATGAVVQRPVEDEAGCLGAAIQARVAEAHARGETLSFADAADAFAKVDAASVTRPVAARRAAYDAARALYQQRLVAAFPQVVR